MHFASLESQRIARVLKVLQDGQKHTTRALIRKSGMCAISAIISEIRANGIAVDCERRGRLYYYSLAKNF